MTGLIFLLLQSNLVCLTVLSFNYCLYDFDNFFLNFGYFFIILVPLEILSHYSVIDSSHWFREDALFITDKFFREKRMVLMTSTLSSCTFLLIFWFLPVFVLTHNLLKLKIYCLPLEAIEFFVQKNSRYWYCFIVCIVLYITIGIMVFTKNPWY